MGWPDCHVHSSFSSDCLASMQEMCLGAIRRGVPEIAFTEHVDFMEGVEGKGLFHADAWWSELERCRNAFRGQLTLRSGLEFGEPHRFPKEFESWSNSYPWDVILGALHWVESTLVFDPRYFDQTPEAAYQAYFNELAEMTGGPGFDVLAHLDIVKRYGYDHYGPFDPRLYEEAIRRILRRCTEADVSLEINTATLRRPVAEVSPNPRIIEWFRQEGGTWITLGSDAHDPDHVGYDLDRASRSAGHAGFAVVARWEARRPSPWPLA